MVNECHKGSQVTVEHEGSVQDMPAETRIIGIDPGLRITGWGIIDVAGDRFDHVDHGTVLSQGTELAMRLLELHTGLSEVVKTYRPAQAAIEQPFINVDAAGSMKLVHARAVAMLVPAQAGLRVAEYAPNTIKKLVVGAGHADKKQVSYMVSMQLSGQKISSVDAADALAVAITHALLNTRMARLQVQEETAGRS